jgi:hypothetical protein
VIEVVDAVAAEVQAESSAQGQLPQCEWVDTATESEPGKPAICVDQRYLSEIADDGVDALLLQNTPPSVFKRNGTLCRLKVVTPSQVAIDVVDLHVMVGLMERSAFYVDAKDNPVFPPTRVARDILAMPDWPFPSLSGIVSTPVLRQDGTILTQPGYDQESGLFYTPASDLVVPELPENPTREDAIQAAEFLLTEVLGDFPYVDRASRANALAAMLTPIVRPVIDGSTPLFVLDKPAPGSGATLQAEVIAHIVTGEPARLKKQSSAP